MLYQKNKLFFLLFIFFNFLKISLFVVGGGIVMIPIIQSIFVRKYKMLQDEDIMDMIAMTQTIPGSVAINCAVFIGGRLGGFLGSIAASFGVVCASLLLIGGVICFVDVLNIENQRMLITFSYIRACVTGVFVYLVMKIAKSSIKVLVDFGAVCILLLGVAVGVPLGILIVSSIAMGMLYTFFGDWKKNRVTNTKIS